MQNSFNMLYKLVFLYTQALFVKNAYTQCAYNYPPYETGYYGADCYGASLLPSNFVLDYGLVTAANGGGFSVQSASGLPSGSITVTSENSLEGPVSVRGALPFLGTVALEGGLPTFGNAAVGYKCGDGNVAILREWPLAESAGNIGYSCSVGCGCGRN